jgi:hypothetical protein
MKICPCGDLIQDDGTICSRCAALHILDLSADANEADVRKAYRRLAEAWQPERFQDDEKQQAEAAEKLKDIESAFDYLTSTIDQRGPWRPPSRPTSENEAYSANAAPERADSNDPVAAAQALIELVDSTSPSPLRRTIRFALIAVALLITLFLGRYAWIAFGAPGSAGGSEARDQKGTLAGTEGPGERFLAAVKRDIQRFVPSDSTKAQPATPQTEPQTSQQAKKTDDSRPDRASKKPSKLLLPYVTLGSTKEEVLQQQGPPTSASDDKLVYGKSELYLKDGSVVGWRIDPSSPIRVKIWPSTAVDPSLTSYTVGSTKDVVLTVQGTPTAFTDNQFYYGNSVIVFRNNKVVSWKEDPDSTPLWAK